MPKQSLSRRIREESRAEQVQRRDRAKAKCPASLTSRLFSVSTEFSRGSDPASA
jgi:hypothetical protein